MIMNSLDDINSELFFQMDDGGKRGHEKKCLDRYLDLMYRNMFLAIQLLTSGIHWHIIGLLTAVM